MGFLDKLKDKLAPAKDKVSGLAQQHGDKIDHGLDKAAKVVDAKTKGKYSDKIQTGTGKAKHAVDRLAGTSGGGKDAGDGKDAGGGGTTPPTPPPTP
ncbi:antitoxin [Streptomyces sp. NPDC050844]|uniref:antitoxin n=1 Tax=Streptomyces sp. NPDC050844 TaxID=3155790 RepID=UPI0033E46963